MLHRIKIFETHPLIAWLIFSTLVLAVLMALMLLVVNLVQRVQYGGATGEFFSRDFIGRAHEYNRTTLALSIAGHFITWIYILVIILLSWRYLASARTPVHVAAGYIALFFLVLYLILLPLSFYRGFTLEHRFGLSTQPAGSWFMDHLKSAGIDLLVNTAALTGIYALLLYLPRYWWLISAAVMIVFIIASTYLYPVLIDPLFYNFKKLEDKESGEDIVDMAGKAGINVREVLVADASRRTLKANAYFTGVGNTRRIVLYDNLIDNFTTGEVLSVAAHEIGHWSYRHILKNIIISSAAGLLAFFMLGLIFSRSHLAGDFRAVMVIILLMFLISFIMMPARNAVSRYFERQADRRTIELTGDPDTQVSLMVRLANSNLSNVSPNRFIEYFVYSHPPVMERIENARKTGGD